LNRRKIKRLLVLGFSVQQDWKKFCEKEPMPGVPGSSRAKTDRGT
jgi:hypothetical protein